MMTYMNIDSNVAATAASNVLGTKNNPVVLNFASFVVPTSGAYIYAGYDLVLGG